MSGGCYPFSAHSWGPWLKVWDWPLGGVVKRRTCERCGKLGQPKRTRQHHEGSVVVVDRGRYAPKKRTRE